MAESYFGVGKGIDIDGGKVIIFYGDYNTDLNGLVAADVPVGSIFVNTTTGDVLTRNATALNTTADWTTSATEESVAAALAVQVSWREPVVARDNTVYADIAAAQIAANVANTINGVGLVIDDRVLFSNITTGTDNVYIASELTQTVGPLIVGQSYKITSYIAGDNFTNVGGPGVGTTGQHNGVIFVASGTNPTVYSNLSALHSWTFTEDTNSATAGDTVYVSGGTDAGARYTYNSANLWVMSDSASADEMGYIRTFIGKSAGGAEATNYSSNTNVVDGTSLLVAIGAIDAAIGSRTYAPGDVITSAQSVAASLDALDETYGSGLITNTGASYPITAQPTWNGGAGTITSMANGLNDAVGSRAYTTNFKVVDGESITASIEALDTQASIGALQQNKNTNVAVSATAISTVVVGSAAADVSWQLVIKEHATATKIESMMIHALVSDAGLVDFSTYAKQKTGAIVAGLVVTVVKNGSNLELRVTATNNVTYNAQVLHTLKF